MFVVQFMFITAWWSFRGLIGRRRRSAWKPAMSWSDYT